jgi:hypothetical protein
MDTKAEFIQPYHGPPRKLAENLDLGDIISERPVIVVDGDPSIGPIPSFNISEAVVVPVGILYVGQHEPMHSVMAFRVGQLVTLYEDAGQ